MMKKTNLYIDGTNLFAGQNDLFGPKILSFVYLLGVINKLTNRFSVGIAHEVKKANILNFKNIFKKNKKYPPHLTIVPIKNPRFIKKRGR